jgi:hypothetical protein
MDIILDDTERVNPETSWLSRIPEVVQGPPKILSHRKLPFIEPNGALLAGWAAPFI